MALTRSQRTLLIGAAVLLVVLAFLVWDFSRRTTFPGKKKPDTTQVSPHESEKIRQED